MTARLHAGRQGRPSPTFGEFVAMIGLMMGVGAFGVDNLLPAFPNIGRDFAVADPNRLQLAVYVYMLGFALTQLVYGPVSDSVGRRPALFAGLGLFLVGCVAAVLARSLDQLLVARFVQGTGVAATRVLSVAIVRDRFVGREMARVMSLCTVVFIIVPVFAPAVGSLLLLAGGWRIIFGSMFALGVVATAWFAWRLPETLRPEHVRPLSLPAIAEGVGRTVRTRSSIGYATAFGLCLGCIMSYVGSSEQVFGSDVYRLGPYFPLAFGSIAAVMGVSALANSRLVGRFGTRRISHAALLGLVGLSIVQCTAALAWGGRPPLAVFGLILAGSQFLVMLMMPNFNAMAMEPLASVAGTASAFIGFYTTLLGTSLGIVVGHAFDGTVIPLGLGYLGLSAGATLAVLWTERGAMFQPGGS